MKSTYTKFYTPFTKVDEERRMVYGYATSEAVDSQGEVVSKEAIQRAWKDYMKFANVREMHQPSAVGVTKEFMHDDMGTWIGVKVVDDRAWKFVKEGVYKGFSIGGRVLKKAKNVIEEIVLAEISLVDRPANPDATFSVVKVDSELVDSLNEKLLKEIRNEDMNYIEIDGVKYQVDPANPESPLIDSDGNKVPYVETEGGEDGAAAAAAAAEAEAKAKEEADAKAKADAEAAEAEAKAKAEADAATAAAAGGADAGNGESKEVSDKPTVTKDTQGVLTLASLLDHLEYGIQCFTSMGKEVGSLVTARDAVMAAVAAEASAKETAFPTGDLAKMADALSKAVIGQVTEKVGELVKSQLKGVTDSVSAIAKDVESIKNTKISPRPKSAHAVEKGFANVDAKTATYAEKRAEVEALEKEINEFADTMKADLAVDPGRAQEYQRKSAELFGKFQIAKRELESLTVIAQ